MHKNPVLEKLDILELLSQAAIVTDVHGIVCYWNSLAEQLYGWHKDEVLGQHINNITPADNLKEDAENILKASTKGEIFGGNFTVKRKDGKEFTAKVHHYPVKQNGEVRWIIGISDEVIDSEIISHDREYLLKFITDNLSDTLLFRAETGQNDDFKILYSGANSNTILGYSSQQLIDSPHTLFSNFNRTEVGVAMEYIQTHAREVKIIDTIVAYHHPSGKQKSIKVYARPYYTLNDTVIWDGICQDVTASVKKDQQINRMMESKDRFVSAVAHDLRSPLQTIRGLLNLLELNPSLNTEGRVYTEAISKSLDKSDAIIADLLEIAEMDDESFELHLQPYGVEELLEASLQKFMPLAANQNKEFKIMDSVSPTCRLLAQKDKFSRMLDNVLSNAFKFTRAGDRIELMAFTQDQEIHILVKDSGIGIPSSLMNILFDRFTKAKRTGLQGEKPTGLGMSIVKQIAQLHGGDVVVSSREEEGTLVSLHFPCQNNSCLV